jgi:hypothetical protein
MTPASAQKIAAAAKIRIRVRAGWPERRLSLAIAVTFPVEACPAGDSGGREQLTNTGTYPPTGKSIRCFSQVITTYAGSDALFTAIGQQATAVQFGQPAGVAVDQAGNVYINATGQSMVLKVAPNGTISVAAGDGSGPLCRGWRPGGGRVAFQRCGSSP